MGVRMLHQLFTFGSLVGLLSLVQALKLNLATSGGNVSSPILYGLLYEDVYHSGDGGLYSELIQNRAFQGTSTSNSPLQTLQYWHTSGSDTLTLDNQAPLLTSELPWQMRVDVDAGATGNTGFWNEGYWGMNITTATRYAANFYMRGTYKGNILCAFWSNTTNSMLGSTTFAVDQHESDGWIPYAQGLTVQYSAVDEKNTFHCDWDGASTAGTSLRFQMISVFQQTYKDSHNGLRMDLAQAVNNLGGKFLRMPGGNNLEGLYASTEWKWWSTVGRIIDRPGRPGTWGYVNTDGLGLLEMMQWCLDMNLEPILAVWDGEYLNGDILSESDLEQHVTDTLQELEFLLGPSTSTYGAWRASLGYPNPFTINYVEIGNEDWLNGGTPSYVAYRFNMYYNAIKAAYPNMMIISSIWLGYFPTLPPAGVIQDLHDYLSSDTMVSKFSGYDHLDGRNPVLVGEYAAGDGLQNPTLQSATSEAVYFLGLERNSDRIVGISHGALIKSIHDQPNYVAMIKHTANTLVLSYSYYVTKLFASNYGSETVPITSDTNFGPLYWAATKNAAGTYFLKIVNYNGASSTPVTVTIPGKTTTATLKTLTGPSADSANTLDSVTSVWTETQVPCSGGTYTFTLNGNYINSVLVA